VKTILNWLFRICWYAQLQKESREELTVDTACTSLWSNYVFPLFLPAIPMLRACNWKPLWRFIKYGKCYNYENKDCYGGFWPHVEGILREDMDRIAGEVLNQAGFKIRTITFFNIKAGMWGQNRKSKPDIHYEVEYKHVRGYFEFCVSGTVICSLYYNNAHISEGLSKLRQCVIRKYNELMYKHLTACKVERIIPHKLELTLNRIRNFIKLYHKIGVYKQQRSLRWVILVKGAPGTGKTFLFDSMLPRMFPGKLYEDNQMDEILYTAQKNQLKYGTLYNNHAHGTKEASNGEMCISERVAVQALHGWENRVPYFVIDEVDRFVASYTDVDLDRSKADMVYLFKRLLDTTAGIVVLITNHADKIDQSILRAGRVNEVIDFDVDYYLPSEKQYVLQEYMRGYGLCELDIPKAEIDKLASKTVAEIEDMCRHTMLSKCEKMIQEKVG
jgi:hypothetical protein